MRRGCPGDAVVRRVEVPVTSTETAILDNRWQTCGCHNTVASPSGKGLGSLWSLALHPPPALPRPPPPSSL